jgi:hypothetical protein
MLVPIDSQILIFYAPLLLLATEYKSQILKIIVIRVCFIHHAGENEWKEGGGVEV